MKALKDCELVVLIFRDNLSGGFKWKVCSQGGLLGVNIESGKSWASKKYTKGMFNKFLNVNKISTKYKFV